MYSIKKVIMRRDGLTEAEADELILEAREMVAEGENPSAYFAWNSDSSRITFLIYFKRGK